MEKQCDKKYTWLIKNFSSLQSKQIYSNQFVAGDCIWRFLVFPKGNVVTDCLSLYLDIANSDSLPSGWKRHAKFSLTIVNQYQEKLSKRKETQHWFEQSLCDWGFDKFIHLTELHAQNSGFLVNGELMIVAEIEVLEVIGKSDVAEKTSALMESEKINGFEVMSSQVESVKSLFHKQPNIALNLCVENPILKTAYMNLVLSVNMTLSQPPKIISKDDLDGASTALVSLKTAGFNLDWLEKKLDVVKENKERILLVNPQTRIHEINEKLKELKKLELSLQKEKADILANISQAAG